MVVSNLNNYTQMTPMLIKGSVNHKPVEILELNNCQAVVGTAENFRFLVLMLISNNIESAYIFGFCGNNAVYIIDRHGRFMIYDENNCVSEYAFGIPRNCVINYNNPNSFNRSNFLENTMSNNNVNNYTNLQYHDSNLVINNSINYNSSNFSNNDNSFNNVENMKNVYKNESYNFITKVNENAVNETYKLNHTSKTNLNDDIIRNYDNQMFEQPVEECISENMAELIEMIEKWTIKGNDIDDVNNNILNENTCTYKIENKTNRLNVYQIGKYIYDNSPDYNEYNISENLKELILLLDKCDLKKCESNIINENEEIKISNNLENLITDNNNEIQNIPYSQISLPYNSTSETISYDQEPSSQILPQHTYISTNLSNATSTENIPNDITFNLPVLYIDPYTTLIRHQGRSTRRPMRYQSYHDPMNCSCAECGIIINRTNKYMLRRSIIRKKSLRKKLKPTKKFQCRKKFYTKLPLNNNSIIQNFNNNNYNNNESTVNLTVLKNNFIESNVNVSDLNIRNYNESTVNETVLKNNFNESNVNVSELNNHNYNDSTVNETESNESSISEPAASEYSSSETTASETTSGDSSDDDSSVNEITEKNEAIIRDNETESFANNNIIPESSSMNYNNETTNDSCFSSENLPTSSTIPQQKKLVCTGQKGCPCESCSSKLPNSKFSFTDKSQIKNNIDINSIIKDSNDVNDNKNQKIDLKNTGNNNFFEKACTNKNNDKIINPLYNYTKISTASTNIEKQKSFSPIIQTPLPLNSSFSICQKQPQESSTNFHQQTDSSISKKQYDDFLTLKQRKESNFKNDLLSKTTNSDNNKICTRNKELNDNEDNLIDYDLDEETIDDVDREKKSSYLSSSKRKFKRKSFSISSRYRKKPIRKSFLHKKKENNFKRNRCRKIYNNNSLQQSCPPGCSCDLCISMLFFKFQHINKNNLKENFNTFSLEDIRRWYNNLSFVEFSEKPEQNQVVDEDVINENSEQNEDKDKDLSNKDSEQNLVIDKDTVNENSEQNEDKDLSNEDSDQNLVLDKDTVNENLDNNEAIDKDIMMDYYFELVNPIKRKIDDIIEYEKWFKFEEHKKFYEGIKFLRNDKSITSNELCDNLNNLKISNNLSVPRYKKRALLHEKYKKRKTEDFYTNSKNTEYSSFILEIFNTILYTQKDAFTDNIDTKKRKYKDFKRMLLIQNAQPAPLHSNYVPKKNILNFKEILNDVKNFNESCYFNKLSNKIYRIYLLFSKISYLLIFCFNNLILFLKFYKIYL